MPKKYFLDPHGAVTSRIQGRVGEDHVEIGRGVLAVNGFAPKDQEDVYRQMFKLKFIRVLEYDDDKIDVEHGTPLTTAQRQYIQQLERRGKRVNLISASVR
jgi:hypothetical protein